MLGIYKSSDTDLGHNDKYIDKLRLLILEA